ncbi:MAG: hypothetical protein IMZ47_03170 [Firmicutes bacterium]|nr:hypothetical protein [Bacillota bacterium]
MFDGNPDNCSLQSTEQAALPSDAKMMACLRKNGVDNPAIFSLLWGRKWGIQIIPYFLMHSS